MTRILIQGCKAGTLAGLIWGLMILGLISPIIGQAEKYEEAGQQSEVHRGEVHQHHHDHHHSSVTSTPDFEPNSWQRPLLTLLGSSLIGIAFGILMSLSLAVGVRFALFPDTILRHSILGGALFGLFGFLIFQGIPSLGLPPELPGIIGAENDYDARQSWWALCVACSAVGVTSLVTMPGLLRKKVKRFHASIASFVVAVAFILVPFIRGVPIHSELSVVPVALKSYFIWVSTSVNVSFWLFLGGLLFYFVYKTGRSIESSTLKSRV